MKMLFVCILIFVMCESGISQVRTWLNTRHTVEYRLDKVIIAPWIEHKKGIRFWVRTSLGNGWKLQSYTGYEDAPNGKYRLIWVTGYRKIKK